PTSSHSNDRRRPSQPKTATNMNLTDDILPRDPVTSSDQTPNVEFCVLLSHVIPCRKGRVPLPMVRRSRPIQRDWMDSYFYHMQESPLDCLGLDNLPEGRYIMPVFFMKDRFKGRILPSMVCAPPLDTVVYSPWSELCSQTSDGTLFGKAFQHGLDQCERIEHPTKGILNKVQNIAAGIGTKSIL
ncbi:hypothetical protein KIPB_008219, partial [Kipferlia bialata]